MRSAPSLRRCLSKVCAQTKTLGQYPSKLSSRKNNVFPLRPLLLPRLPEKVESDSRSHDVLQANRITSPRKPFKAGNPKEVRRGAEGRGGWTDGGRGLKLKSRHRDSAFSFSFCKLKILASFFLFLFSFFFFFFFLFFFFLFFFFFFFFDVQGLMQCLCHAKQNEKCVVWVVGLRSRHVRVAYVKTNTVRIRRTIRSTLRHLFTFYLLQPYMYIKNGILIVIVISKDRLYLIHGAPSFSLLCHRTCSLG